MPQSGKRGHPGVHQFENWCAMTANLMTPPYKGSQGLMEVDKLRNTGRGVPYICMVRLRRDRCPQRSESFSDHDGLKSLCSVWEI